VLAAPQETNCGFHCNAGVRVSLFCLGHKHISYFLWLWGIYWTAHKTWKWQKPLLLFAISAIVDQL